MMSLRGDPSWEDPSINSTPTVHHHQRAGIFGAKDPPYSGPTRKISGVADQAPAAIKRSVETAEAPQKYPYILPTIRAHMSTVQHLRLASASFSAASPRKIKVKLAKKRFNPPDTREGSEPRPRRFIPESSWISAEYNTASEAASQLLDHVHR